MRTPDRDRCRSAITAVYAALVIALAVIPSAGAISAEYLIYPNGTAYHASVEVADSSRYEFVESGLLGEPTPLMVRDVQLSGNCSPCHYNLTGPSFMSNVQAMIFDRGNYTVSYVSPLRDNHLQVFYKSPYNVTITLPQEFDVRNPLLGGVSPGANITRFSDNSTKIQWNTTMSAGLRFYDPGRETLLYFFLQFMGIIAVVMLVPFFISMRKRQ